ncbi:FliA/WhiG family RNA polymerase sigma factor [Zobellella iuensis]|uniref:FliA/WhiG family RNA polymerase sigma factor n=1 Tax=Zobellella iuensis TaxID=2803811 RepID=A0ABS1QVE0_9GAMM|nr:FliA/WhiG family RNA polymerase sigma factor [Zobellella iuensis]MBL1378840.1 FliA/WhiG family RNA polymerase sigma factor [Zobellella iuensis]
MLLELDWSTADDAQPLARVEHESHWLSQYMPLVRRVLGQLKNQAGTVIDADDLAQIGIMGLLEALRRYGGPPDEGFAAFAFKRIRGAILDELRRHDWRPRQLRQQSHQCSQVERELMRRLGRRPSEPELAQAMGVDIGELRDIIYAGQMAEMESLQQLLEHGVEPAQEASFSRLEQQRTITGLLERLPEREQRLMSLYYQHELNMKEIALVLDLTESRVCQLHKQCLALLNRELTANGEQ